MTTQPSPLTPEDIRELARLNHSGVHSCSGVCLAVVVATLDAARAGVRDPEEPRAPFRHAHDREGRRLTAPDSTTALREAAMAVVDHRYGSAHENAGCVMGDHTDALRAALRSPAPLDVEGVDTIPDAMARQVGSEYGRLLAERDRLIAQGVDPADLEVPLAHPETEEPA